MAGRPSSYQKNLEFIAKDIGKELIPFLSTEERLMGLTPEDLVRVLPPEELVRALTPEERLIGLTPEDLARVLPPEERRKLKQLLEGE